MDQDGFLYYVEEFREDMEDYVDEMDSRQGLSLSIPGYPIIRNRLRPLHQLFCLPRWTNSWASISWPGLPPSSLS